MGAGLNDGTFHVFETLTWRSEGWSHRACGFLVDATWSAATQPPSLLLLCSRQLAALHFTEDAPALDAQLLPLSAPQVFDQEVTSGRGPWSGSGPAVPASGPPEVRTPPPPPCKLVHAVYPATGCRVDIEQQHMLPWSGA